MTTLKKGSRGEEVKTLQRLLNEKKNYGLAVDGIFGIATQTAVENFQYDNDLMVDGIVGPKTWGALQSNSNATTPTPSKNKIVILIDNGHGEDTAGKRSPDGRLREYKWTREVATRIVDTLKSQGYDARRIVTEDRDVSLSERVRRVNNVCSQVGAKNVVFVSVHINAASGSGWSTASGWCGYVAPNASENSKKLAQILYAESVERGLKGNRSVPSTKYWTGNFYVIRNTNCPSVLTENLFQTNQTEVNFLLSEKGKQTVTDLHVAGLKKYIAQL